jgi:hypothetical protein
MRFFFEKQEWFCLPKSEELFLQRTLFLLTSSIIKKSCSSLLQLFLSWQQTMRQMTKDSAPPIEIFIKKKKIVLILLLPGALQTPPPHSELFTVACLIGRSCLLEGGWIWLRPWSQAGDERGSRIWDLFLQLIGGLH